MNISVYLTHPQVDCWNFKERHKKLIEVAQPDATVTVYREKEEFIGALPMTEIALVWNFRQEWFARAERLAWIVTPAAGKDYFSVTPPPGVDIDYCSFHGEIIGETVIGMILAHTRGVRDAFELRERELWPRHAIEKNMRPFRGSHLVVLGFGNIGQWIGKLAKPFGVRITGFRRSASPSPDYFRDGDRIASMDELDDVLPTADHLALALPGDTGTTDMIDDRRLRLLPRHATICNVGRGNAIDEDALARALSEERIAGAYLDVFKEEPLPAGSSLRRCRSVTIMPHASAISPNYLDLFTNEFIVRYRRKYVRS